MRFTSVFENNIKAYNAGKHIIVNKGGTRSSKTISILQLLYLKAAKSDEPLLISVVSESFPHLNRGCIRDFKNMLLKDGVWDAGSWNATYKTYKVKNSMIEFFSADAEHGTQRDILYMNECINMSYETYRQLAIRTSKTIFLDCNPCFEFWLDEHILTRDDAVLINSTYKDNRFLSKAQVSEIESNKDDAEFWKVYGLGETGSRMGLIMQNWDIIDKIPDYALNGRRYIGMDFGFTNNPTAIVDIYVSGGELYINELLYNTRYDNLMIADFLASEGIPRDTVIVADSAEEKSISEIAAKGWKVQSAIKGAGSVQSGISIVNRYKKHITNSSLNIIREFRNYRWSVDDDGKPMNEPVKKYDHACDALRYVVFSKLGAEDRIFKPGDVKWIKPNAK